MMIKFLDIYNQDKKIHKTILNKIKKLFKKGDFILGDAVFAFEEKFRKHCGSKYAIGCANGTDALTLALKSLNLPKNSEVIIPAMTYCSTAFAVINAGLKPILVDIEKNKPTMCIYNLKKKINSKTKVILPVHLYGSVANLKEIRKLIGNKKIYLVDDCAQAHGAFEYINNKKYNVGSIADISCFSLYPGKNLGAYGDAGIITTNSKIFFNRIRKLRNLGSEKKFKHEYVGVNSRLDSIQAIVLNEKIKFLDRNNLKRQKIAKYYNNNINNKKIKLLEYSKYCVYHQYLILTNYRAKLERYLKKKNIQYGFHYPNSLNQIQALKKIYKKQTYYNAEKIAKNSISLPIDPNLNKKKLDYIIKTLNNF